MEQSSDTIIDLKGNALPGVALRVFAEDGSLAQLFSDNGLTPVSNPTYTDQNGRYVFYAANGRYTTRIEPPDGAEYDGKEVVLFDPKDAALPISIQDFGAKGDGVTDSLGAFNAAIAAMPETGGKIAIGAGTWYLSAKPTWGMKSIYWDIDPTAIFIGPGASGPGKFLKMVTNGDCTVNGPYILAQRAQSTIDGAASFAMGIESIQDASDTNSGYGALYVGAQTNATGQYSINSAINAVATANPGSSGNVFVIEADVATFADPGTGTQFGLLISGFGGNDCTFGFRVNRHDGGSSKYLYGGAIAHSRIGLFIDDKNAALENGIVLGDPPARFPNNMLQAMQISNGGTVLLLQRRTNTAPTGNYISCINADNTNQMFKVDVAGVVYTFGLRVREGANAKQGVATLAAGVATVANTSVTANSRIFLTSQADGGTPGFLRVSARVAGTSFTITSSSNTDTSTVAYQIFEPA